MLLAFLSERPGVKFEAQELVGEFGRSRDAIRMALSRLFKSGLIERESRTKTVAKGKSVKYKVYFVPEVFSEPNPVTTVDTSMNTPLNNPTKVEGVHRYVQRTEASESKDSGIAEQTPPQTSPLFSAEEKTTEQSASPTTSAPEPAASAPETTISVEESTAQPTNQLKVGDRVANIDPTKTNYNWHGTIVRIGKSKYSDVTGADVSWDERKGMKGGQILFHRLEELRLI